MDKALTRRDLYALTNGVLKRVSDSTNALQRCPITSLTWQMIAEDLAEAAVFATEIERRIKQGEIR